MPEVPQSTPAADVPDTGRSSSDDAGENADDAGDKDKARDLLRADRLARRERLGERLLQRVGGRMWDRPNLACSSRLYKRFQIDDPWAPPGSDKRRKKLGLGPVNLRFGEGKRQPAPHLKVKDPNKKKKAQAAADPVAKYRRPQPKPKPQAAPASPARPAAAKAPNPAATNAPQSMQPGGKYALPTGSSGEFGGGKQKRGLVGKLPQRPDLVAGKAPPRRAKPPQQRTASKPQRAPAPTPAPARAPTPKSSNRPSSKTSSSRPQAGTRKPAGVGGGGGGGGMPLPRPKLPTPKKRRAGRFRMSPTEVRSPVVRNIQRPEPVVAHADGPVDRSPPAPAKKKKVDKPIDRSIPTGPMGLDDLFGSMDGGRMRFGRKRKKKDAPEDDS